MIVTQESIAKVLTRKTAEEMGVPFWPRNFVLTPRHLPRVEICPAARVYSMPKPKGSFAQFYGIFLHRYLEYAKTRGEKAAMAYILRKAPRMLNAVKRINVAEIPDGETEPSFLIDVMAGTAQIGSYFDAEPETHFFAKGDLVWRSRAVQRTTTIDRGGVTETSSTVTEPYWVVWDYKSGSGPAVETSEQVRTLAMGVWLREGRPDEPVQGAIVIVTANGDMARREMWYTPADLENHARRLRLTVMQVAETRAELITDGAVPEFHPGEHCKGCDIFNCCPALKACADGSGE